MTIKDTILTATYSLVVHKLRSFLTILGVVIGVMAITIISSLGKGSRLAILSEMEQIGACLLWVGVEHGRERFKGFDDKDIEVIKRLSTKIKSVSLETSLGNVNLRYNKEDAKFTIVGVNPSYQQILRIPLIKGRFISSYDYEEGIKVCVLEDSKVTRKIFGFSNPVGRKVLLYNETFRIIGVVGIKRGLGTTVEGKVYVPLSTFFRVIGHIPSNLLYAQAYSFSDLKKASLDIKMALEFKHQDEGILFEVFSLTETLRSTQRLIQIATLVLGGIAAISLLVSGIGIANIMLVSIVERTREIGLRKAIGATKGDILFQFLTEAVVLSVSGGGLGVIFGLVLGWFIAPLFNIPPSVSFFGMGISLLCSIAVGLISGIYPAYRAANLTPIDALRYE